MILVCVPSGRGNWSPATFAVEGTRISPLLVKVGGTFLFAGIVWRIRTIEV